MTGRLNAAAYCIVRISMWMESANVVLIQNISPFGTKNIWSAPKISAGAATTKLAAAIANVCDHRRRTANEFVHPWPALKCQQCDYNAEKSNDDSNTNINGAQCSWRDRHDSYHLELALYHRKGPS
jgi:hypothetical protein